MQETSNPNTWQHPVPQYGAGTQRDTQSRVAGAAAQPGPLTAQTPESYAAMFDTNVLGTLLSLEHELRVMQPRGAGSIINISSTMGERGAANLSLFPESL